MSDGAPNLDELRTRLKEVMDAQGLTQVDLAKAIGVSQSVVSRFLRAAGKQPSQDSITRFLAYLGDEDHPEVLSHEEIRQAVRLYRYIKGQVDGGSNIVVRDKEGNEQTIVFLW